MIKAKKYFALHRRAVLTLLMCGIALISLSFSSNRVSAHEQECCGAGACVPKGACYPGEGNTGSICGDNGIWEVGCTGN